jgi:hypothetical protein
MLDSLYGFTCINPTLTTRPSHPSLKPRAAAGYHIKAHLTAKGYASSGHLASEL